MKSIAHVVGVFAASGGCIAFFSMLVLLVPVGCVDALTPWSQHNFDAGPLVLWATGIGVLIGAISGLYVGIRASRNEKDKRNHPDKRANYTVTFSAKTDQLPKLVKLIADQRLQLAGVVIKSSEVAVSESFGRKLYAYQAVIEPGPLKEYFDKGQISDIPGQTCKLLTRNSIAGESGRVFLEDCVYLIRVWAKASLPEAGSARFKDDTFIATVKVRLNGDDAELLKPILPAGFATLS
jgi:hypothetical protein